MAGSTEDAARAFYEVSKRLKSAEKGVRAEFHKAIREAAKPLLPAVRRQAAARFPKRGGAARHMAQAKRYRTAHKTGATTAGVSIRANKSDPRLDTRGRMTHPIPDGRGGFLLNPKGKRLKVVQYVPEAVGFFSNTIEERADLVRDDMVRRLIRYVEDNLAGDL